jgi:putative restriction endonuclease
MKYWLGVTDNDWFTFLSSAGVDEVNFWQPSGKAPFVGLEAGAPFLFKLKRPYNHVAGGGIFVKFSLLPLSLAWDAFGIKNGAPSRALFEAMIRKLMPNQSSKDPEIGCTILSTPIFWPREQWIENPEGWSGNIVRGRYYDTEKAEGLNLWTSVQTGFENVTHDISSLHVHEVPARYGNPVLTMPRLGQGGFRVVVTDAYSRRCAMTGEHTLPVLEAAHILPFAENGPHEISNGMLLRSDFHKLFDGGLVTVTPEYKIEVSPRIREEWFNGKTYYRLHGEPLANLPMNPAHRPNAEYLRWHNDNRFQA